MTKNKFLSLTISGALLCAFVIDGGAMPMRGHGGGHGAGGALARLDTNGDGVVSLDEFVAARTQRVDARFQRLDANGDELVTIDEIEAAHDGGPGGDIDREAVRLCIEENLGIDLPDPLSPEERFDATDTNGDGAIELAEMTAAATDRASDRFGQLDIDGDGALTLEELQAAGENRRAFRQARRACVEEQQSVSDLING